MYERRGEEGVAATVPLGDLKLGDRIWRGPNRSAARQRAYVGIRHDGSVEFGYGELTAERSDRFDTFIALRRLYAHLLNMTKRQTNRFYFTEIRETKRNRAPVVRAKRLVQFGHGELDKLPRLATDCT